MSQELIVNKSTGEIVRSDMMQCALSVETVIAQAALIEKIMKQVMQEDEHYGVIPGTKKPTLFKAGAEKICSVFRLAPRFEIVRSVEEEYFILFSIRCVLIHIPTGQVMGEGLGSCSSREEKYGWRKSARKCPKCHAEAIIKGKVEYGGGWVCFASKGGCKAKFSDGDKSIESQEVGRIPAQNVWDQHNTILKMAQKRAQSAAVLVATAASDIFTQDLDEKMPNEEADLPLNKPVSNPNIKKKEEAPKSNESIHHYNDINVWITDIRSCQSEEELKLVWEDGIHLMRGRKKDDADCLAALKSKDEVKERLSVSAEPMEEQNDHP